VVGIAPSWDAACRGGILHFTIGCDRVCLPRNVSQAAPHPGGFWQRVQNRLKKKELSFCCVQKSAQGLEKTGDSSETRGSVRKLEGEKDIWLEEGTP